ncbi:MAG TPA: PP2C family protein-serine/threonine phosphatase [Candidatus Sulfotelmatobacter sp.]
MARRIFLFLVLITLSALSVAQPGQFHSGPVASVTIGPPAAPLYGPWKFAVGDSPIDPGTDQPLWAEPGFDDSNWEAVDLTPKPGAFDPTDGWKGYVPGWTAHGHPGHSGFSWYRIRVQFNPAHENERKALALWDVDDAYQCFADGRLLGSFGEFPGQGKIPAAYYSEPEMFILPGQRGSNVSEATPVNYMLALRVWMQPYTLTVNPDAGGLHIAPVVGEATAVGAYYQTAWLGLVRTYASSALEAGLFLLLTMVSCSLLLFDRADKVYPWLGGVFLLTAANAANLCLVSWTQAENQVVLTLAGDAFFAPVILGGWVMVWWMWFRLRHPRWVPWTIGVLTLLYGLSNALGEDLFFKFVPHSLSELFHGLSLLIRLLFLALLVLIVIRGVRQQGREGWLALPAVILVWIAQFQTELLLLHFRTMWFPLGTGFYLSDLADAVLSAVIFVLLLRRLMLSFKRQREMALDVKQAQEVQQVILPEMRTTLPGLIIESEYRPAREVGGDFFQILPHPSDGSLLIVAGDVTGKGLKAGMLVSLLVGAMRSTAETETEPSKVLAALNRRLLGRGNSQATCLAIRIAKDGEATLANAGHLPPYLNGEPVAMEGALPLGITEDAESSVMHFRLNVGDRLVLISDGIIEATNAEGHLFGFERLHQLLRTATTAGDVAAAAQSFGQEDDISVIAVTLTAILEPAAA